MMRPAISAGLAALIRVQAEAAGAERQLRTKMDILQALRLQLWELRSLDEA